MRLMTLADQGFLELDEMRLEYRVIGPRPQAAPTIVMLHEGLGSVSTWGAFPDMLSETTGCGVFVYSRAGYGKSSTITLPRPLDYMQREAADVLPKLLDVPISVGEAVLGGKVEVPTLDGRRVEVKVRPGTSSGVKLRLPGFGIAGGDQYLVFKVEVPGGKVDEKSRELIEEFAKRNPQHPRANAPWV